MSRKREPVFEASIAGHGVPLGVGEMDQVLDRWLLKNEPGAKEIRQANKDRIERSKKAGRSSRG